VVLTPHRDRAARVRARAREDQPSSEVARRRDQAPRTVLARGGGGGRRASRARARAREPAADPGLALAISNERQLVEREVERLQRLAFHDELTGLPNQLALKQELEHRLEPRKPAVTVLHVDFDGMREANNALGYETGGDFLIRTVGQAIPGLLGEDELVARLHRAGDEFACVLRAGEDGQTRAAALEAGLALIPLPDSHKPFYRGASVGWDSSEHGDDAAALIACAAERMRERKRQRRRADG
jgi:diguanylate cyclase (GGDEF)-like protein